MTVATPTHPVIRARDDDGTYGFDLRITAMDQRTVILEAEGASVTQSNNGECLMLSVRSDRRDFEGDSLYLLRAELVPGRQTWIGPFCEISGVLTEFLYRTEEDVDREIIDCPSGDGIYVPKGPMPEPEFDKSYYGHPALMMQVKVQVCGRRP